MRVRQTFGIVAFTLALAVPGCRPAPPGPPQYTFTCADGYVVNARFGGDSVVVTLPDTSLVMRRLISADGGRYGADSLIFWEKGNSAFVMQGDSIVHRDCLRAATS